MTTKSEAGSFSNYWDMVVELLGGANPKRKTTAIEGAAASAFAEAGETNVRKLWMAMGGSRWAGPASASDMNWTWRAKNDKEGVGSKEVALERKIVDLGGRERWSFQMPTSSGLEGPTSGRRRSIDLVHRTDPGHYTFIELKCCSDQPLYASFEVLGYCLAYLCARRHLLVREATVPEVLSAQRIDLLVLGPRDWYLHKRRNGKLAAYQLAGLERAIAAGLSALSASESAMPQMGIGFRFAAYASDPDDTATAAREIVDLFDGKLAWPKLTDSGFV